ncbi:hypothetical protein PR202_ga30988 [Eleusine coracana subsp. coracana]|uniref:Single-strand DNA endonuclease 1 chromo domain-containing protein n=1 Tax=Eleusine coracana subsp. coracana TaxID=191504 RepID=A0AAV5DR22_ELECO|nr:hypothetical protein PR202_ga30988 [Eleusine coracana subsp. coracana]
MRFLVLYRFPLPNDSVRSAAADFLLSSPPARPARNKKVCVDLSCWLVQLCSANRSPAFLKDKVYLKNLFHRIRALLALNCSLIFVTVKLATYRRRLGSTAEAAREEANSQPLTSLRRNKSSEFSRMIKEAKHLGMALGIPCLDGVEEAEAQCALLNLASLCERVVVICYEMEDIEKRLGFGRNSLISLAVLLGGDYSDGVHGFGPEAACRLVKSAGDDVILDQILLDGLLSNDILLLQHRMSIGKPKCHSPDSEAVQRACSQRPFLRSQLQQICEKYFEWSAEKTDEYILPKIAERELRKFSNLRSTSSALGMKALLSEIPVPCPVLAIVKQRKVHGNEHYEVSWRNIDGLQVSVVPGDLIRSACPEKITEFLEKKDDHKKQKRRSRPKKSAQAAIKHVDVQLQELLLDIESESSAFPATTNGPQAGDIGTMAPIEDIVDLSSPSPPVRACKIARSRKFDATATITMDWTDLRCPSLLSGTTGSHDSNAVLCGVQCLTQDSSAIDLSPPLACAAHKSQSAQDNLALDVEVERRALSDISNVPEKGSTPVASCCKHETGANHMDVQPLSSHGTGLAGEADCPWRCDAENNAVSESTMIDLSSPIPVRSTSNHDTDVIDIGESDSDRSPEHDRKARDLRPQEILVDHFIC